MTASPKTKYSALVDKVNKLLPQGEINSFVLRGLVKEAKELAKTDAHSSYLAQAMLACLDADVDKLRDFHDKALVLGDDDFSRQQYGSSLSNVGLFGEALVQFEEVFKVVKDDAKLITYMLSAALYGFQFQRARELIDAWNLRKPDEVSEYNDDVFAVYSLMREFGITDEDTLPVQEAFTSVMQKGFRGRQHRIMIRNDDDFKWVEVTFYVHASIDELIDMNFDLAGRIAESTEPGVMERLVVRFSGYKNVSKAA